MAVAFRVLGPLGLVVDGTEVPLGGGKEQLVLAALLLDPNRVVPVERIVDWVWGDERPERLSTLQVHVSNLRRRLGTAIPDGGALVQTRRPGYVIELADHQLDSLAFQVDRWEGDRLAAGGDVAGALRSWRGALARWRGQALAGLALSTGAQAEVSRLDAARWTVVQQVADAELGLGHHAQVVDELGSWVAAQPLDERLRGQLMLALYRCGRQADALACFREGRELLLEELGIDPSKGLRDLEGQILRQEPALDLPLARPFAAVEVADGATVLRSSVLVQEAHLELASGVVDLRPGATTIGRRADRDLVLDDPSVSRVHAEIRSTPAGCTLVDRGSANGTRVNGCKVAEHPLVDGDVIEVGDTTLVFRAGPPPPA